MKTATKTYAIVDVKKWWFSHFTINGNGVYSFTIQTETGEIISGKTAPGLNQHLSMSPAKLADVTISTTPTGRIKMTNANRA